MAKLVVIALLRNKLWAYPWLIVTLVIHVGFQLYRIAPALSTAPVLRVSADVRRNRS